MLGSRTAMALMAGVLFLGIGVQPKAGFAAKSKALNLLPVAASIELDQKKYFLGENVLLHFCVENIGKDPFEIDLGGDYRMASRHLRFRVEALDAAGRLCDDPDPSGFCEGGISHSPTIKPGQKHYESIPLLRYRRIETPGAYTIRVSHDLGWTDKPDRKAPVAEATIEFVRPSQSQAKELVEAMMRVHENHGLTSGEKNPPYRDFSVLRDPVYLPVLVGLAKEKSVEALMGIGSIAMPEATEALIQLAGNENAPFALSAAQTLDARLPDPQLNDELPRRNVFIDDHLDARRWLVKQSWLPRFADAVAELAHRFLAREDREGLQCGGYMLQCVGTSNDLPYLVRALDREIAAVAKRPPETDVYPRPRGACEELLRAANILASRGLEKLPEVDTPGGAVVYLCTVGGKGAMHPVDWERQYARLMQHESAYVREVALRNLPSPVPESLRQLLPALITHKEVDVQIAACHIAEKEKRAEWKGSVLKAFAAAREQWLLNAASNAAFALGAHWETIEILVARLDEVGMTKDCLHYLAGCVIKGRGSYSGPKDKWTVEEGKACKARWVKFLLEHAEQLKAGQQYKPNDPAITPDLFPTMKFRL